MASNVELAVQFFLQIAVILVCCRVVGLVAARFGQPQVIAEMITGVLLGPSLFGWLAPELQSALFPWDRTQSVRDTQSYLYPASQLGLALYMFIVGLEFRVDIVRTHLRSALAVSMAGMAAPFVLGAGLATILHRYTELFGPRTSVMDGGLFLGASLCVTALPVLARIIHFKGLAGSRMGTVAIGAGAINDAAAWCLLALVLARFDDNPAHAAYNMAGGVLYVGVVLGAVRPLLSRLRRFLMTEETLTETGLAAALSLMALGAWFTDLIGLHAVFGAFLMGAAMPRGIVSRDLITRLQPLTVGLLLPLYFTYSGLNTKIGLINTPALWGIALAVLAAAIFGKGGACWLAARWTGIPGREALGIGTLMNARGLMELIIINIGLERGIISEGLFATLVLMAVVTTLMTSPLFDCLATSDTAPAQDDGLTLSMETIPEG
jgi:Kef-type K+ transport system membrane component KefB